VRDGYRALARREPRRFAVVDAAQPQEQVWQAIERVLARRVGSR
jgi:thymidylate kinase